MVSIPTESIETILHEEISVRKVCAKWVPYTLTNENKQKQFKVSKQLFGYLENGFRNIITGDETWLHFFTVSSKDANEVWLSKGESWPQIIRIAQNSKKQIFCIFFSADGVVASIVVEKGHTVTGVLIDDLVIPFTADRFLYIATVGVTPELLMFLKVLQMILIFGKIFYNVHLCYDGNSYLE
nr:2228_t:CDS:2 [Entrophospora candida]